MVIAAAVLTVQLVQTLAQLRKTLGRYDEAIDDFRKTLAEIRETAVLVKTRVQSLSSTLEGVERTAGKMVAALEQMAAYVLKPILLISGVLGGMKAAFTLIRRKKNGGDKDV